MKDTQKANAALVEALGSALREGDHGLKTVPALLKRVLVEESWRQFVTQRGEHVEHERFADFIATPPLKGLGASADLVRRIIADDTEVLDLLDQALQNPAHIHADVNNINVKRPDGTSQAQALRRLRKDAPELHAQVLEGRLTAHAAMVKAGFRRRSQTIRLDNAESAAKTIRKHMSREARVALARLLLDE